MEAGAIAGIVVAVVVVCLLIGYFVVFRKSTLNTSSPIVDERKSTLNMSSPSVDEEELWKPRAISSSRQAYFQRHTDEAVNQIRAEYGDEYVQNES